MSVNIGLSTKSERTANYYLCQCRDWPVPPGCVCEDCNNRGVVRLESELAGMNIGAGNAIALFNALGFPTDNETYGGSFTLKDVQLMAASLDHLEGDLRSRYYRPLATLLAAAIYHEDGISWG